MTLSPSLSLFNTLHFLEFQGYSRTEWEAESSHVPLTPHTHNLLHRRYPVRHFLQQMNLHGRPITSLSPGYSPGTQSWWTHLVGLNKCIMTWMQWWYYTERFHCPKIPLCGYSKMCTVGSRCCLAHLLFGLFSYCSVLRVFCIFGYKSFSKYFLPVCSCLFILLKYISRTCFYGWILHLNRIYLLFWT